jgi:ABC-2 type transport system permease protein
VIIPAEFGTRLNAQSQVAQIQVLIDGAEPNTANYVRGYVNAVWAGFLSARAIQQGTPFAAPISIQARYWFNPNAESRWFLIPGSMTIIMTLLGTLLTSLVVAREWERGTLEALYATPLTRGQILIGKTLPYFVLAMISMAVCVTTALVLFRVPLHGSLLTLGLVSAVFLIPALGQGLLISVTMRSQFAAAQLGLMTGYLPAMMLSGFVFDIHSMPAWLRFITWFVPARYMNVSLQTVFLAGDLWGVLVPNMIFMLLVGALFFGLTWRNLHKRVD